MYVICVCMHTYMDKYIVINTYPHRLMDVWQYTSQNVYIHIAYIHTHTCMCTHKHSSITTNVCNMCIYIHTYASICPCKSSYKCKHMCINTFIHYACILVWIYTFICMFNMCIYGYTYANVSPCMSAYIHVYL